MATTAGYKTGLRSSRNVYVYYRTDSDIEHPGYNVNKATQSDYSSDGLDGVLQATLDGYGSDGKTQQTVDSEDTIMSYNPITDRWQQVRGEYVL